MVRAEMRTSVLEERQKGQQVMAGLAEQILAMTTWMGSGRSLRRGQRQITGTPSRGDLGDDNLDGIRLTMWDI